MLLERMIRCDAETVNSMRWEHALLCFPPCVSPERSTVGLDRVTMGWKGKLVT